jgi:hypothetical protein
MEEQPGWCASLLLSPGVVCGSTTSSMTFAQDQ